MIREEQITYKAGTIADGCIAHGAPWQEYYQGFIEGARWADANPSKPSLPSNLDKAAEEYAFTNWEDNDYHEGASEGVPFDPIGYMEKVFKAGAKWMARQGETHEQYVIREIAGHDIGPAIVSYPDTFEIGDKVIVQIRKEY